MYWGEIVKLYTNRAVRSGWTTLGVGVSVDINPVGKLSSLPKRALVYWDM